MVCPGSTEIEAVNAPHHLDVVPGNVSLGVGFKWVIVDSMGSVGRVVCHCLLLGSCLNSQH